MTVNVIEEKPPEPPPTVSIRNAARVTEGSHARFEVRLSKSIDQRVRVSYATQDGTATAGSDYVAEESGTVTFDANDTREFIEVETTDDDLDEPDEDFTVTLSNPNGATLGDDTATGTIGDNDDVPQLSINDVTVLEGETAQFEVSLRGESGQDVTVRVRTVDGTAEAGSDYDAVVDETLTFPAGSTARQTIDVTTTDDSVYEGNETFTVRLSNAAGAGIDDGTGDGTITDNDDPPTMSIGTRRWKRGIRPSSR